MTRYRGPVDASRRSAGGTQELLDQWWSGVGIVSVAIRSVDPPPAVLAAFRSQDVQNAG
ncbi:MAG: hypothetical protein IPP07_25125 [Holophagales bacterium]|nr:hypothetical protein [Holophagales bacterium]